VKLLVIPAAAIAACMLVWPAETFIGCAFVAAVALVAHIAESWIRDR